MTAERPLKEYQRFGTVYEDEGHFTVNNLFDEKNRHVSFTAEAEGEIIEHFWVQGLSGEKIDLIALLPSSQRITVKKSNISRFSAAIDDKSKALLEWNQNKKEYTTEDILSFLHELGHAMDGVQISYERFVLRVRSNMPVNEEERLAYLQDEEKAQENALKILRLLIRKKILVDNDELQKLLSDWDTDYRKRVQTVAYKAKSVTEGTNE